MRDLHIALGIPTCAAWMSARAQSLRRLLVDLGIQDPNDPFFDQSEEAAIKANSVFESLTIERSRASNHVWSARLWSALEARASATHVLQLQDDVLVAPGFGAKIKAMLSAMPEEIVALESAHPGGMTAAREGRRWYSTVDGLIGVGWAMPREIFRDLIRFRKFDLKSDSELYVTEDTLIGLFAVHEGIRILSPVPTIIDHDLDVSSTYGNEHHPFRRPLVTWRDGDVLGFELADLETQEFWTPTEPIVDFGRFYHGVHRMAQAHTLTFTQAEADAIEKEVCPPQYARFFR